MRICIFTDSFMPYISGVSSTILNQANEMARRGHEVSIFHPTTKRIDKEAVGVGLEPSIATHGLPLSIPTPKIPKLRFAVPLFIYTYRRLRKKNPDLIHCHTEFGCGLEGMLLGRWKKVPVVGTFHTFFAEPTYLKQFHLPNLAITRYGMWKYSVTFYNRCNRLISPSDSVRDHLVEKGIKTDPIVMSNGIEMVDFLPSDEIRSFRESMGIDDFAYVYVGRISPEKSMEVALEAFGETRRKHPKAKFVVIGNGPSDEAVDSKIRDLGLGGSVIRTGRVERDILMSKNYPLLGDAFITASKTENQPISILEAMAFGLPLVGPKAKGIPELVEDGKNGYLFEPDDVKGMSAAMNLMIEDRDATKAMGEASLALARTHSMEAVGDRLEGIYQGAIESMLKERASRRSAH
ncbi:MAG: glycosyltransferase [Verrucomicrobiota bacterium]